MKYLHRLRIFRHRGGEPGAPVQDEDTGVPGPVDTDDDLEVNEIYDGPADVQDKGTVIERDTAGTPTRMSDAMAFIPDRVAEDIIPLVQVGDIVEVWWNDKLDTKTDGSVEKVIRLDNTLALRYL